MPRPDVKLKDDKNCHRHTDASPAHVPCRFGYCMILLCSFCGLTVAEWGPIACPHKKNENGTLRWYKYPDMDEQAVHWGRRGARKRKRSNK